MRDMGNNRELMDVFYEEARELIDEMREGLAALGDTKEEGRGTRDEGVHRLSEQSERSSIIHRLFRCAHTIKGNSQMVGLRGLAEISGAMEEVLRRAASGTLSVNSDMVLVLSEGADACRKLLDGEEVPRGDLLGKMKSALEKRREKGERRYG